MFANIENILGKIRICLTRLFRSYMYVLFAYLFSGVHALNAISRRSAHVKVGFHFPLTIHAIVCLLYAARCCTLVGCSTRVQWFLVPLTLPFHGSSRSFLVSCASEFSCLFL